MQPSIISPVPIITFDNGEMTVTAVYHSEYGAPIEDAQIGVATETTSVAADTEISGETITGVVLLEDITQADESWSIGDDLTVIARTKEQNEWSEARYTSKTCGNPTVAIASGGTSIPSFPAEITWSYDDYDGFFQNKFELTLHTNLMGDVVISEYTSSHSIRLNGEEIAYGAAIGGTEQSVSAELVVYSTSGLSKTINFDLSLQPNSVAVSANGTISEGRMLIECEKAFFLFALRNGKCEQCAYTESGTLDFMLPINNVDYFAVTLNESRIGRADTIEVTGLLSGGFLDYVVDGIRKRIKHLYDVKEDLSGSTTVSLSYFAGRLNPVAYFRESNEKLSVGCLIEAPCDVSSLISSLRGVEGVYRSAKDGIYRVVVESASNSLHESPEIAGTLSMSLDVVDGSPYELFYESPFFEDGQLYPGSNTYPSSDTWTVG